MALRSTGRKASKAKASQAKRRKNTKTNRRVAPVTAPRKRLTLSNVIKELHEAREQQTATSEVLQVINASAGNLTPVFDAMLERAMRLCEASFGALAVLDGELARWIALRGITGLYAELITSKPYRRSVLFGPTHEKPSVSHILDLKDSEGYRRGAPSLIEAVELGGVRTWLVVPLLRGDTPLGAFVFYRQEVRAFSNEHILLLQNFAHQAVIAMENARLLNELRQRTDELARLFENEEARARELAKSLEDLRAAQDRLIRAEKLTALGRLVAGVAHEINTPVGTSLTIASSMENRSKLFAEEVARGDLRRSSLNNFLERSRDASSQITANLNRAAELISLFKQLANDATQSDQRPFDLGDSTKRIAMSVRPALRGLDLTLNVECQPNIAMNSHLGPYGQVLTNLFLNAAAHAFPDGRSGTIDITARELDEGTVEIIFSDNGCGMSPEIRRQAFDPFFTTRRDAGRTGLGLHIVHSLVTNSLGGRIVLESSPGEGTRIQIVLPRVMSPPLAGG